MALFKKKHTAPYKLMFALSSAMMLSHCTLDKKAEPELAFLQRPGISLPVNDVRVIFNFDSAASKKDEYVVSSKLTRALLKWSEQRLIPTSRSGIATLEVQKATVRLDNKLHPYAIHAHLKCTLHVLDHVGREINMVDVNISHNTPIEFNRTPEAIENTKIKSIENVMEEFNKKMEKQLLVASPS
jgi:hypothetical protein